MIMEDKLKYSEFSKLISVEELMCKIFLKIWKLLNLNNLNYSSYIKIICL